MVEDIHEPVAAFQRTLKDAHAQNTSSFFENLVQRSGVDEAANAATVKELRILEQKVGADSNRSMWWRILRGLVIGVGVICAMVAMSGPGIAGIVVGIVGALAAFAIVFLKLNPIIKAIKAGLKVAEQKRDAKLAEAWQQMAPLNGLYDWSILAQLVTRTVPRIALDPYFSAGRLKELHDSFGWSDEFNRGSSVLFSHSGGLNGNPFVIGHTLNHWMGTKSYDGSLTIQWTVEVKDSEGRWHTETRTETLHASVTKPFPEYGEQKFVIYGNEAAPDLSFSRNPSNLSGIGDGAIGKWRKGLAVKKIEKKSRNLDNSFTVMANREFDALFGATNRDHEVQFRLLFTPLAQQEMVKLLNDKEVGYGDDFSFSKARMINLVEPAHMRTTDISADPAKFRTYELAQARRFFNDYHNDLFKSLFFGIAPLLTVPLYQQHRSHADIYRDVYARQPCFWEHESIANYFGEAHFQHPECVTRNILKTQTRLETDGTQVVGVAAFGYGGINRTDYVSVYGGDGNYHDVPVHWIEYIAVRRDSEMVVRERSSNVTQPWQNHFQQRGIDPRNAVLRRSILAALRPN